MAKVCSAVVSSTRVIDASTRVDAAMSMIVTALTATPAASAMVCAMLRRSTDEYDVGEPERVKVVVTVATRVTTGTGGGIDGGSGGIGQGMPM